MANKKPLANYSGAIKELQSGDKIAMGDLEYDIQSGSIIYAADAGASDAYAITLSPVPSAYTTGMVVHFKANTANTGAATLNVNSLGAKTIKKNYDSDLADNDIKAGQLVSVIYDGTNFQMLSPVANVAGSKDFGTYQRTTSFSTDSLIDVDVTGMSHAALANKNYKITLIGDCITSSTVYGYLSIQIPSGALVSGPILEFYDNNNSNISSTFRRESGTKIIGSPPNWTHFNHSWIVNMSSTAGDIKLRARTSNAGYPLHMYAGFMMIVEEL